MTLIMYLLSSAVFGKKIRKNSENPTEISFFQLDMHLHALISSKECIRSSSFWSSNSSIILTWSSWSNFMFFNKIEQLVREPLVLPIPALSAAFSPALSGHHLTLKKN